MTHPRENLGQMHVLELRRPLPRQLRDDLAFAALTAGDTGLAERLITGLLPDASPRQEVLLRREL